ncbi:hypothetical protein RF11_03851 [Thelohanellus kitauei]|uniref:Uncharacterized protein n=1 Tax=Thelohanellus kitauei TaxID=669202 RepID=A0A0C2J9I7_THEKT|nr:hypothetical protein RF11_03851 [Thelohanellus kitauei]
MLKYQYDEMLHFLDVEMLLPIAIRGILSDNEEVFNECQYLFKDLFMKCQSTDRKKGHCTAYTVTSLFNSHSSKIVKNCFQVITSRRKISFVKGCGSLLNAMNNAEKRLVQGNYNVIATHIRKVWKEEDEKISSDESLYDKFIELIDSTTEEEAVELAVSINAGLYNELIK